MAVKLTAFPVHLVADKDVSKSDSVLLKAADYFIGTVSGAVHYDRLFAAFQMRPKVLIFTEYKVQNNTSKRKRQP